MSIRELIRELWAYAPGSSVYVHKNGVSWNWGDSPRDDSVTFKYDPRQSQGNNLEDLQNLYYSENLKEIKRRIIELGGVPVSKKDISYEFLVNTRLLTSLHSKS
jgi:hypothetical protein